MSLAANLSVDDLARRCAEETEKFNQRQLSDAQFCFELLRRALAEGLAEELTRAYQIYERQVLRWVYAHSGFAETGESADFFVRAALSNFYFALRGEKFHGFPALPHLLSYLKLCVHSAITQYLRSQRHESIPIEQVGELPHSADLDDHLVAAETWAQICALLPDPADRLLARCAFLLDLKPRQVVVAYPQHWSSEREVSVALYRIRRLLRGDPGLRQRFGYNADERAAGA